MNKMAVRNYNGHFLELIREVQKNECRNLLTKHDEGKSKCLLFCVEEHKGLAYRLEGL